MNPPTGIPASPASPAAARPPAARPPDALRTIWTHPHETVAWLLEHGDRGLWIPLAAGASLVQGLATLMVLGRADLLGPGAWPRTIGIGLPLWFVGFLVAAFGLAQIGQALGGRGVFASLRVALAWAATPVCASLPLVLIWLWGIAHVSPVLALGASVGAMMLWLWAVVLTVNAVAEAHAFGIKRALASTLILGALITGVALAFSARLLSDGTEVRLR